MPRMDDSELRTVVDRELTASIGYSSSDLSAQREQAMRYYLGERVGPLEGREGRSSVVLTDVADTIEWMMPSLMRMFTSGEDVVEYHPKTPRPGDPEEVIEQFIGAADDATDYINWVFMKDNPGFLILYTWFKDALLQKNGIVKYWWEETDQFETENYVNLTDAEAVFLEQQPDFEVKASDSELVATEDQFGIFDPVEVFEIEGRRKVTVGRIAVESVPPEEFLISRWARRIKDSPFTAHWKMMTRSELIEQGYPRKIVERLPTESRYDTQNQEQGARFDYDDTGPNEQGASQPQQGRVKVYECYIQIDADGDGVAELLKVTMAGNEILDREEAERVPFADITPIIMPHKFFGLSIADLVKDLQEIRSTIMRQILDNMYQTNNERWEIPEGIIGDNTLDDHDNNTPGAYVRTRGAGGIRPLPVQATWQAGVPMLEVMAAEREARTGVTRYNQGLNADSLNKTATGINRIHESAQQRIELIARIFAETGMKDLFAGLLGLAREFGEPTMVPNPGFNDRLIKDGQPLQKADGTPLTERFKELDPSSWPEGMMVNIRVGLGTGAKDAQAAQLTNIYGVQMQLRQSGDPELQAIATPTDIYETLTQLATVSGVSDGRQLFTNPEEAKAAAEAQGDEAAQQQQQQMEAMIQMQQMMAEMQAKIESMQSAQEHQQDMELQVLKGGQQLQLQSLKGDQDMTQQEADNEDEAEMKAAEWGVKAGIAEDQLAARQNGAGQ